MFVLERNTLRRFTMGEAWSPAGKSKNEDTDSQGTAGVCHVPATGRTVL